MIDVFNYCAYHNNTGSKALVASYGIRPSQSHKELAKQLAFCMTKDREGMKKKMADIHPDKDLFEAREIEIRNEMDSKLKEKEAQFQNMNGSALKSEVAHFMNASGPTDSDQSRKTHEILMIGGIIIISLAIIMKK